MISVLEARIQGFDDTSKSISEASREISTHVDASLSTITSYVFAKRAGFGSHFDYQEFRAMEGGHESRVHYIEDLAHKRGFPTRFEYMDQLAQDNGFQSQSNYGIIMKLTRKKFETLEDDGVILLPKQPDIALEENEKQEEDPRASLVREAINLLTKREQKIIRKIYFQGKSLRKTGEEIKKMNGRGSAFRQAIFEERNRALEKIKDYVLTFN